jgi:hypothetical protein
MGVCSGSSGDAGITGYTGDACSSAADCNGSATDRCIPASSGWPGGYCSNSCSTDVDCPVLFNLGNGPSCFSDGYCYAPCFLLFSTSLCRAGYVCVGTSGSALSGSCRPDCRTSPSTCPFPKTCSATDGICR